MQTFEQWESEIRGYCRAFPTVFDTALNARQTDEAGKSYIDFFAGAGVLNFGHNNPLMQKALIAFIERNGVAHSLDMYTTVKRDFIDRFAELILKPRGMNHKMQFMGPTGTNAVEAALKLARRVTGRRNVVAFTHGFHGMTLGSLACTANEMFRNAAGVPLDNVTRLPFETAQGGGIDNIEAFRALLMDGSGGVEKPAAFLVEPIQAEGGVNIASEAWLKAVQQLAKDTGALFILDDIQAGCGRTGSYFSFDGLGLDPDIICLAKGIGGYGTPLAMNLNKPEHDKHWKPGEHTGTFRGQSFSFVCGREALSYFADSALMKSVKVKGAQMADKLKKVAARCPASFQPLAVRGNGMMQAIDMRDGALSKKIATDAFNNGLLIGPCGTGGRVIKLIPPLTIPDADLTEGLDILENSIVKVLKEAG